MGIELVRVAVRKDHFDVLNSITVNMFNNPDFDVEYLRSDYGKINWTYGRNRGLPENFIEVFITRDDFINISIYGKPDNAFWKVYQEEDVKFEIADKYAVCGICKKVFKDHPLDKRYLDNHGEPYLNRICDGKLYKL